MRIIFLAFVLLVFASNLFAQDTKDTSGTPQKEDMWWAKSVLGEEFSFVVEEWVSEKPDMTGKFKVVEFWGTWCGPCKKSIPHLNELSKKFKDNIVFIGVSDESVAQVKSMKEPVIEYYSAVDSKDRMKTGILELKGVPHAVVVDPDGIVCWEGAPDNLTENVLNNIVKKFELMEKLKSVFKFVPADSEENQKEDMWWAKSVLGQKFPLIVEAWVSEEPDTVGKFRVVEFWGTWCGPCKKSIPHLNELSKKFQKEFVFVGISDESVAKVKSMKEPVIEYYNAVDTKRRLHRDMLALKGVPHAVVVNPDGIACWEGGPDKLSEEILNGLIEDFKLAKNHK